MKNKLYTIQLIDEEVQMILNALNFVGNCLVNGYSSGEKYWDLIDKLEQNNTNEYKIAKQVEMEDFKNAMENMGYNPEGYSEEQIKEMFDKFEDILANDDMYNAIYNDAVYEVVNENIF